MKELNKKMTDFIKNKGSKINENFYEKEIHDSFDFPEKFKFFLKKLPFL